MTGSTRQERAVRVIAGESREIAPLGRVVELAQSLALVMPVPLVVMFNLDSTNIRDVADMAAVIALYLVHFRAIGTN